MLCFTARKILLSLRNYFTREGNVWRHPYWCTYDTAGDRTPRARLLFSPSLRQWRATNSSAGTQCTMPGQSKVTWVTASNGGAIAGSSVTLSLAGERNVIAEQLAASAYVAVKCSTEMTGGSPGRPPINPTCSVFVDGVAYSAQSERRFHLIVNRR
jgi:hypothetical protein